MSLEDRLPPQNLEAEQGVLGSMILDPEKINDVADQMAIDDLYRDAHQILYRTILGLWSDNKPVDALMVADALTRQGELKAIGGEDYLAEVIASVPHPFNAKFYAQIVRQKSVGRQLVAHANETLEEAYSNNFTAEELLAAAETRVMKIGESSLRDESLPLWQAVAKALHAMEGRRSGEVQGVSTGLSDLDFMVKRLQPRRLYVLAARPSIGKSALALNIADHAASEGKQPVLFISLEMDGAELGERYLLSRAHVNGDRFERPLGLSDREHERLYATAGFSEQSRLVIEDPGHMTLTQLCARVRRHKVRHGLGLFVLDYLQLVDAQPRKGELREREVAKISNRLKGLAKELYVPVLALAQINRQAENRDGHKPTLADLRESGQIEADADVVMLLHRPEFYDKDDQPGKAFVIVPKHRGGPTGTVELRFVKEQQRFEDAPDDYIPAPAEGPAF